MVLISTARGVALVVVVLRLWLAPVALVARRHGVGHFVAVVTVVAVVVDVAMVVVVVVVDAGPPLVEEVRIRRMRCVERAVGGAGPRTVVVRAAMSVARNGVDQVRVRVGAVAHVHGAHRMGWLLSLGAMVHPLWGPEGVVRPQRILTQVVRFRHGVAAAANSRRLRHVVICAACKKANHPQNQQ